MFFLCIKVNHTNFTNEVIRNTSTQIIFTVLKDQNTSQIIHQDLHHLKTMTEFPTVLSFSDIIQLPKSNEMCHEYITTLLN